MSPIPPAGLCCSGGGGEPTFGIGGRVQVEQEDVVNTLTANDSPTDIIAGGPTPDLLALITNPYTYDLWVNVEIEAGTYLLIEDGYTGRFAVYSRILDSTGATVATPFTADTRGRDGVPEDPSQPSDSWVFNAGHKTFGFLLPAGTAETISQTIGVALSDDGTDDTYTLITQDLPSITYVGVPVL